MYFHLFLYCLFSMHQPKLSAKLQIKLCASFYSTSFSDFLSREEKTPNSLWWVVRLFLISLFLSLASSPATCSLTQSTSAALVSLMFPQYGWYSPTSGPLHLLLSSHDSLLPQTAALVCIRNLVRCFPLAWDSLNYCI